MAHSGGNHVLFLAQKIISKKFLNSRSLPLGSKQVQKRHCTKVWNLVFSWNKHLENTKFHTFVQCLFCTCFVPRGRLWLFKNFFEIIFLGKKKYMVTSRKAQILIWDYHSKVWKSKKKIELLKNIFFSTSSFLGASNDSPKNPVKHLQYALDPTY